MAASVDTRVGQLEGEFKHVATKADLNATESRLIKWMAALVIGNMVFTLAAILGVVRLLPS